MYIHTYMYTYHISVFLFEDGWLMFFVSALTVPLQKREKSGCKDWIKNLNSQKVVDHFWGKHVLEGQKTDQKFQSSDAPNILNFAIARPKWLRFNINDVAYQLSGGIT